MSDATRVPADHPALSGITVLERGWLSSNNIVVHAADDEPGALLVDTGVEAAFLAGISSSTTPCRSVP